MKVLVIAAHPDDEVLGCGGTIAKHVQDGDNVSILILGEGITSRGEKKAEKIKKKIKELKENAKKAASILGVKKIFTFDFPDNRFDTVPLLDIIKVIEDVKKAANPEIVYTHHAGDLNIDHQITLKSVLTAFRPIKGEKTRKILSFEVPSSTEWGAPGAGNFIPNLFVDISKTIDKKIEALRAYKSELREYPHPRSPKALKIIAGRWGSSVGLEFAEAFVVVREVVPSK